MTAMLNWTRVDLVIARSLHGDRRKFPLKNIETVALNGQLGEVYELKQHVKMSPFKIYGESASSNGNREKIF